MLYVLHALDRSDGIENRAKHYREHRAHLDRAASEGVEIVSAGSLVASDGETPIGSLIVVDAADQGVVQGFCERDPYRVAGVWEVVQIHPFIKRRGWASPTSTGI